jgi:hypothetical protein
MTSDGRAKMLSISLAFDSKAKISQKSLHATIPELYHHEIMWLDLKDPRQAPATTMIIIMRIISFSPAPARDILRAYVCHYIYGRPVKK